MALKTGPKRSQAVKSELEVLFTSLQAPGLERKEMPQLALTSDLMALKTFMSLEEVSSHQLVHGTTLQQWLATPNI